MVGQAERSGARIWLIPKRNKDLACCEGTELATTQELFHGSSNDR